MLKTVHLYGDLAEKYGDKHKLDVKSVGEAMRALEANHNGFLKSIKRDGYYEVVRGETLNDEHLDEKTLGMTFGKGDFHISPMVEGSGGKNGGIIMAVIGVALLVVAYFVPVLASYLVPLGISLIIGGVGQMLAGTPSVGVNDYGSQESPEERSSFYFSGPTNTMEQGGVLPLVYGRMTLGSTVVSAGIKICSI